VGVLEEIQAVIDGTTLTPAEKRAAVRVLRARAWRDALDQLPHSWQRTRNGHVWEVTITDATRADGAITLHGTITRDGIPVSGEPPIFPITLVNPPLLTEDVNGSITRSVVVNVHPVTGVETTVTRTYTFALPALIQECVLGIILARAGG
jgi:hypothetical protein